MGSNCSSSDNSDDELHAEDNTSDVEGEAEKEISGALDIGNLFDATLLRNLASIVKDDIPDNIVQQHSAVLVRWLEEKVQQNEETVTLSQFYDVLMNRTASREDCLQAFQQFDSEGDGTADAATMLESLKSASGAKVHEETAHVVRTLQACTLLAGFIDVYNEDKGSIGQHGTRLLNFLLRNRAPTLVLPFPILNGFNSTTQMRLTTLENFFSMLKETASRQEDTMLHDGEEIRPIDKCFSLVDVSTNKADAYRMFNKDFASYWQSDGSARSHWIRLKMKSNVVVKQLSVGVALSDQSYMPNLITVAVGKSAFNLREIKEVRIPNHTTGDVVLVEDLKVFYPIVQINIKRCQSDGCDTRIHHCKILGYRIVKDSGVSVTDASAAWYLQIMASTAIASIPVAPQLRDTILQQTKLALRHMPPLSLSPSSNERPSFMSTHVLKEIDKFLTNIVQGDNTMITEGLTVLLAFNLARGHVSATLNTMIQMQEHEEVEFDVGSLLTSINKVRDTFWKRQGGLLQLTLTGCDGGKKEEMSGPNNVIGANWSASQAYLSGDGKRKVNMFFEGPDHVQITKIRIKVDKGPRGPRCGLVFVFSLNKKFDLEEQTKLFSDFDDWRTFQYNFCQEARTAGIAKRTDLPVAYFNIEDDWDEVEVAMDSCKVGKYVLIKFLEPRNEAAERLGIVGIKFYGFHRKAIFTGSLDVDNLVQNKDNKLVTKKVILPRVTSFLTLLSRDQDAGEKRSLSTRPHNVDMSNLFIGLVWKLYNGFDDPFCRVLSLELLHSLFPFLANSKNQNRENSEEFFQHLCSLVDAPPNQADLDTNLHQVAKQVIVDGAAVFFPDKEARRKQLFNMMTNTNTPHESPSMTLTFQSLCQFFSSVDPSGLLDLPNTITKDFNEEPVLQVLETLITVAYKEFHKVLDTDDQTEQSSHLVQLLCSLQTSLLAWAHRQITADNKEHSSIAQKMLVRYVNMLSAKVVPALKEYQELGTEDMINLMSKLEKSFLSTVLRQMVLILTMLTNKLTSSTRTQLMHEMLLIGKELQRISPNLPQVFYKIDSEAWKLMESGEVILRTWEVESPHNYDNNMHTKQIFSCPGASSFIVDFDVRCETEKRYDYLEFTDSRGIKMRLDQKVGTEKWPAQLTLHGGHRLQFLFHSDSSNNEWGYKFKVMAKGCPDVPLSWLFDLQLSLSKLTGRLGGASLDVSQVLPKAHGADATEEAESDLLKSELWTTLFRGGYTIGRLQRSLSGRHTAEDSDEIKGFLISLSEQPGEGETMADKFYIRCQENCKTLNPKLGGEQVSAAVRAVFAALIWHTQQLREDMEKYVRLEGECKLTEGIIQSFNTAESLRLFFAEQRQKQKVSAEKTGETDLFDSVGACTEKALFLLKFAGLSKVHLKSENKAKHDRKYKMHNRLQIQTGEKIFKLDIDRHPSFRLVLDFVRDPVWSKQRVEQLLQQRCQHAQAVSEVYMLSAEFIRITAEEHIFQIPTVVFLQELFSYQDKFAKHYADGLDGCGLELESKVRRSFYTLVRRMVDSVRALNRLKISRSLISSYDFMVACTLHLLDVSWQFHDLFLLVDLRLPELYIKLAKGSVSMRENVVAEVNKEKESAEYKQNMKWQDECNNTTFCNWYHKYQKESIDKEKKKAVQMFVARFCDLLDVEISCDGCTETLPGRRYRCLQCMDMDLCSTCFAGGVKPDGEHTDDHEIVHLQYKCDECYAFIVGTRIHCTNCENFDLCLGCHDAGHFPAGHSNEHKIETYPMIKWKTNKVADSSVMSYIHQHVWLLYCSLALSMANLLYQNNTTCHKAIDNNTASLDPDYIKAATQIYNTSIELAVKCLMQVSMPDDVDTDNDDSPEAMEARQEEAFAIHSQERIAGLLGAMLPSDEKTPLAEDVSLVFSSVDFLSLLFYIASGESGHETNTQHFALGLIGRLLQRKSAQCQVVDSAVALAKAKHKVDDVKNRDSSAAEDEAKKPSGIKTKAPSSIKTKAPKAEWIQIFNQSQSEDEPDNQKSLSDHAKSDENVAECSDKGGASDKEKSKTEISPFRLKASDFETTIMSPESGAKSLNSAEDSVTEIVSKLETMDSKPAVPESSNPNATDLNQSETPSVKPCKYETNEPSKPIESKSELQSAVTGPPCDKSPGIKFNLTPETVSSLVTPELDIEANGSSVDPPGPENNISSPSDEIKPTVNSSHDLILSSILRKTQSIEKLDEMNKILSAKEEKVTADRLSVHKEESSNVSASKKVESADLSAGVTVALVTKQDTPVVSMVMGDNGCDLRHLADNMTVEGQFTADYLFSFGATCLERSGLDWANSMAAIISKLFNSPTWRNVLLKHLSSLVDNLKQNAELSSIFALFVVAGFPEVLSIGSHVRFMDIGTEMKEGFVLKHFPDKSHTLLVDKKSRKRRMVKDEYVECLYEDIQILDHNHIAVFIQLITTITARIQSGESVGVANMWVLSLTLKALSKTASLSTNQELSTQLFGDEFVRCVVYLASQGTGFSKQWLLKHLEILSLMLYTRDHEEPDNNSKILVEDATPADKVTDKENCPPEERNCNPWDGLDDTAKFCFQTLHEYLDIPVSVLRAIYTHHNNNTNALLMEVYDNIKGITYIPSEEMIKKAKMWEMAAKTVNLAADKALDTGVQLLALPTEKKKQIDEAEEEPSEVFSCPVPMADNDMRNNTQKQRRTKSSSLLKKELETQGKLCDKDFLVKVNMAMTVLYARQMLTALLADWPTEGRPITAQLLGCKNSSQMPFVLDLLHRPESKDLFKKVVQNLIKHCQPEDLVPIAMTACQFMEEVSLTTITKESEHNYRNNSLIEDSIHIPGAPFLTIKFDSRCSTEESCDELLMSSSPDFKLDKHLFSGLRDKWINFDMPGDILYYKFTSDCSTNDWGFRFTVTGGRMGRFDTGYMVLSAVLIMPAVIRSVPLDKLWHSLVYVACKQTGQQRLKAVQLMLKLIQAHFRKPGVDIQPLDLSLLRPLWLLYCKMAGNTAKAGAAHDSVILPESARALTELFIRAEDLAMDWGMSAQYAASLEGPEMVQRITYQALMNIAAVSIILGQTNAATKGFKALEDKLSKSG